jgi:hypothetical protein
MTYLQMIKDGLANRFPSLSDVKFLYLPDEKLQSVQNIVNESKRRKGMPDSIKWLHDMEHAQEKNPNLFYAVGHCIGAAIHRHNVDAEIYYVFGIGKPSMQSIYIEDEKYYVIFIEPEALKDLLFLCYRIKRLTPFAEMTGISAKDSDVKHPEMPLVNIIHQFCDCEEEKIDLSEFPNDDPDMFLAAMTYVIGHELAHIFNGHLAFFKSDDFKAFSKDADDENITQQTLEMDADCMATDWGIALRQSIFDRHSKSKSRGRELIFAQVAYISGIYAANLYRDSLVRDQFSNRHPSGYSRFLIAVSLIQESLHKHYPDYGAVLPEIVRQSMVDAFSIVAGGLEYLRHPFAANALVVNPYTNEVRPAYHEDGVEYGISQLKPLHARWSQIRPYLEKHRLGKPLAPAQNV